ncbi:HisA/HisF-related TIM barrel protein [Hyphomicrobium sp.]|uniref:HisA/HisF-related TIM barrel protein n=1 Tax=Hyphomicrobium sp. TaxID=82 RepID=UPI002E30E4BB|nr:HisA/HisF-related TIM barrel protein [Hyphomicrobium sp.]HEX2841111.1 HisA/HisF-related TIM barrel protein [Hyphomicrobium sp.]
MEIIPVIDVRGGVAVAAVRGDRARYRPLESPLAASPEPVAVALGLRTLFPFQTLYVADLDGIEGRGAGVAIQQRLSESWPGREVWIDDGDAGEATSFGHVTKSHVLGSESLGSVDDYACARSATGASAPLSLDFRGDAFLGPPELLEDATLWPDRLIVMTLARVGSGEGPDLARLGSIIARSGARKVFAAGGVRDANDLRALRDIGAAGALVATALHRGQIARRDLQEIAG